MSENNSFYQPYLFFNSPLIDLPSPTSQDDDFLMELEPMYVFIHLKCIFFNPAFRDNLQETIDDEADRLYFEQYVRSHRVAEELDEIGSVYSTDEKDSPSEGRKTMKQKESYLHQIGFFLRDINRQPVEDTFNPIDFSSISMDDIDIQEEDVIERDDFGVVRDIQRQATELNAGNVDRRPNWAKVSYPEGANQKLKDGEWPEEYTTFRWPEDLQGKVFPWLTKAEHRQFEKDFPHLLSYLWNVLHNHKQKHTPATVQSARKREISYHKFSSVVCQHATYFKNLWKFCVDYEGSCPGWKCFLSTKRMRAFHEYCRFRAGSPNTANNKAKYTQEVCQFLMAHFTCLRPFSGELWIVSQQAGLFRRLMKQQQQVRQINKPNYQRLLRDGKTITAEQLKRVHATVFINLKKSMEKWDDTIGLLSMEKTRKVCGNIQTWLQMLCHFKVGGQRQEVILHMTRVNFTFDEDLQTYVLRPNFREKKIRKLVNELIFPADCNPFFRFFVAKVRPYLLQTDDDPLALWLSISNGNPQDPSAMTRGIAKSCAKIIPGTHMTSLRWRHLLVTLAYLDDYLAGHSTQQNFLEMLANIQNHDVGTLMQYYNDANVNLQAAVLINRFNQDYLQSDASNVAAVAANDIMPATNHNVSSDSEDEIMDDLRSISDEDVIYSDRYRAQEISGKQIRNGHIEYEVQWETRTPTWERITNLKQYLDLVEQCELRMHNEINAVLAVTGTKRKRASKEKKSNKCQRKQQTQ